ncbi:MAG TPA: hypothetical protein VGO53_15045 [Steroidobacteraceae bacterium]|nr:hypothetical protein [Steroidobacteraceae bacterium]
MFTRTVATGLCRLLTVLVLVALASACGGGGGGDSGGGGGGGGSSGGTPGTFTINKTSAAFSGVQFQSPSSQDIAFTLTGTNVAQVGAAFNAGQEVSWLGVSISGNAPNFIFTLNIIDTTLAPGHYSATLQVGTADAQNNILQSKSVTVTYDVRTLIGLTSSLGSASFVYGGSVTSAPLSLSIDAPGKSWTLSANGTPWLLGLPSGTQTGSATLPLTIDATALIPGSTSAFISLQNTADSADFRNLVFTVTVAPPTPVISVNPVVLGGTDGLAAAKQAIDVAIDTGTNQYPWTLTLTDTGSAGWLTSTAGTGSLGGTQHASFDLGVDRTKVVPGRYSGNAKFAVTVKGSVFSVDVPVLLNWQSHRLFTPYDGIALAKTPSAAATLLTRTLPISSSRGRAGVAWTATSSAAWLHVTTPSGTTGGASNLTLTADPNDGSVQVDAVNVATVTLASSDPTIERNETIRVGFWVSATAPAVHQDVALPNGAVALAANPVEPYAYVASDDGSIRSYNIYTGSLVQTWTPSSPLTLDAMVTSSDGKLLFATDPASRETIEFDAATLTRTSTPAYQNVNNQSTSSVGQNSMVYARPNGHPVLWSPFGETFDLEAKGPLQLLLMGSPQFPGTQEERRAASADGAWLFSTSTISQDSSVDRFSQTFTVLGQRGMEFVRGNSGFGAGGSARDMCVAASGDRVASLGGVKLWSVSVDPTVQMMEIPGALTVPSDPNTLACGWDNRIYVGLSTANDPQPNLYIFDADGAQIGTPQSNGPTTSIRTIRQLRLSGDARRAISTTFPLSGARVLSLSTLQ